MKEMEANLRDDEEAAKVAGVWQTDSSQHTHQRRVTGRSSGEPTLRLQPQDGRRSLRVLYLFSGVSRRASIAESLKDLCTKDGFGLEFHDVDIHVGGSAHDLLASDVQETYMANIHAGEYDVVILSPPCGSWSRANWANNDGPPPCRDRQSPWGFADNSAGQRGRAERGNEFVHFSIRAIQTAALARAQGHQVRCLLEHPEDLGRVGRQSFHQGVPASIWQLPDLRSAFGDAKAVSVAGWQCQFPGVDYSKPTRLFSDIPGIEGFGRVGWPIMDANDNSRGPLPRYCGHSHGTATIGRNADGGYNVSPTAAYPEPMCRWLAARIYDDWKSRAGLPRRGGRIDGGSASHPSSPNVTPSARRARGNTEDRWSPWTSEADEAAAWRGPNEIHSADDIATATAQAEAKGTDQTIKDGIDQELPDPSSEEDTAREWAKVGTKGDDTTDEETELGGCRRPKRGEGFWGAGQPLKVSRKGLLRDVVDGAGLCSPGRWAKARRKLPQTNIAAELQSIMLKGLIRAEKDMPGKSFKATLAAIVGGKLERSPFSFRLLDDIRTDLRVALRNAGFGDGLPLEGDRTQQFEVRLIQCLLWAFGDPDAYFGEWWARGVWLGSQRRKLPRTPAVFERKVRWKFAEPTEELHGEWQTNYPSLREHAKTVNQQFEEEAKEGLMLTMTLDEAIERFGEALLITATGAIEKKGKAGEVRVIFDASHGVLVNLTIRVRDQVRCPASGDAKAVLSELRREGGTHVCIVYDVSKAHRRVPVLEEDWGRQACQVRGSAAASLKARRKLEASAKRAEEERLGASSGPAAQAPLRKEDFTREELDQAVWVNTVGTFGVASAGYWWGRAGAALMRLSHYFQGLERMLWLMLYSDDCWATASGDRADFDVLLHLLVLGVVGTPLAWHKLKGGQVLEWIGYALDVGRFEMGITEKRVQWAVRWLRDKLREGAVRLGELREGLGRLQFVAGPLEHIRPFLGPLYAWASAGPRHIRPLLPVMIKLILEFLARELSTGGMVACAVDEQDLGEVFRLDAKAEGDTVAIGGWRCRGVARTKQADWFAVSLNRRNAPWAFQKGEAFRTIASLELLGVLVGLMVLVPEGDRDLRDAKGLLTCSCGTDNLGNTYIMDRLMTTKYPLCVVLMEVAHQCRRRGLCLRADWVPRLENQEADDLTNLDFKAFDPTKRLDVDLDKLGFGVLNDLFALGDQYVLDLADLKAQAALAKESSSAKKRKPAGEPLRARDPW